MYKATETTSPSITPLRSHTTRQWTWDTCAVRFMDSYSLFCILFYSLPQSANHPSRCTNCLIGLGVKSHQIRSITWCRSAAHRTLRTKES
ncbi:hypothetical protein RRG08_017564 [Elysia crispata]|uniref:Uncharacterized protein n=1 Tax=Elysia crispata TaxID=231223 RepID=A0AAE1AXT8_9GAST|nr:hypothetical protein RRG08_017564 [Elysia crispata]